MPKPHLRLNPSTRLWTCLVRNAPVLGRIVGYAAINPQEEFLAAPTRAYRKWRERVAESNI
jgi:hypothetical protein